VKFVKFHFGFCWLDKRSFSIFANGKKQIVRRTAGLSLVLLGWERKEKLKFGRSQATSIRSTLKVGITLKLRIYA
jgi:hypothetical protein